MKNRFGAILIVTASIMGAAHAFASPVTPVSSAPAANITQATSQIKEQRITVRQISTIGFGMFASEAGGGRISINPASGTRIIAGNISSLVGGDTGAAEFEIIGQPEAQVIVNLPTQVLLSSGRGSGELTINNLQSYPDGIITLNAAGRARIRVGGTMNVPGKLMGGSYNGMFNIDVRYL